MADEQELLVLNNDRPITAIEAIDQQILSASTNEIVILTQTRTALVQQQEYIKDREHLRKMESRELALKAGLSVTAIASGTGLVLAGFGLPGFVALGAGLYCLAPSFIDQISKRIIDGGGQ